MVKHKYYTDVKRNMAEYRLRTSYSGPVSINRSMSDQESARSARRQAAQERTPPKPTPLPPPPPPPPPVPDHAVEHSTQIQKSFNEQEEDDDQFESHRDDYDTISTKERSCCTIS